MKTFETIVAGKLRKFLCIYNKKEKALINEQVEYIKTLNFYDTVKPYIRNIYNNNIKESLKLADITPYRETIYYIVTEIYKDRFYSYEREDIIDNCVMLPSVYEQ